MHFWGLSGLLAERVDWGMWIALYGVHCSKTLCLILTRRVSTKRWALRGIVWLLIHHHPGHALEA